MEVWIKSNWKWIIVGMIVVGIIAGLTDKFGV
jgi:hypothetical protein